MPKAPLLSAGPGQKVHLEIHFHENTSTSCWSVAFSVDLCKNYSSFAQIHCYVGEFVGCFTRAYRCKDTTTSCNQIEHTAVEKPQRIRRKGWCWPILLGMRHDLQQYRRGSMYAFFVCTWTAAKPMNTSMFRRSRRCTVQDHRRWKTGRLGVFSYVTCAQMTCLS